MSTHLRSLSRKQAFFVLAYSLIFPITNLIGGIAATVGIVLTIPFLTIAWVGGVCFASVTKNEDSYLFGAFVFILIQVYVLVLVYQFARDRYRARNHPRG